MSTDDLRQKAITYLEDIANHDKEEDEFDIYEISVLLNKTKRSALAKMEELVKKGIWETRLGYVSEYQRRMRLWRLKK